MKFCVANNEFIFGDGDLGGKCDMTNDSFSGLHILNFLLSLVSADYLYSPPACGLIPS